LAGGALAALVWTALIRITGGFVWETSLVRLSSRDSVRPLGLAVLSGLVCWCLAPGRAIDAVGRVARAQAARLVYCVAAAGAGLLVFQWLGGRPLWLDEEMIALNLRDRTIIELAQPLSLGQTGPFGWLALQHLVLRTFGPSEIALRAVPVLFGVGMIGTSVWIGRRWMGSLGAVTLTLCCALGQWVTFYCLELKHYSADVFWALLVPALAAWAIDISHGNRTELVARARMWWMAAAVGLWFGNGALFVTPGCALVLVWAWWQRGGWPLAWRCCLCAVPWALSFAGDYVVTLHPASSNAFLADFWAGALPPRLAGVSGTLRWIASQVKPLAIKPGGVHGWVAFWLVAASGLAFLIRARPIVGLVFLTVPVSAAVLAGLRLVPLYERLSLWVVPAVYVGIAYFVETSGRIAASANYSPWPGRWLRLAAAGGLMTAGLAVVIDVGVRGIEDVRDNRPRTSQHQLDDRMAVRALVQAYQPGDAVMTTRLALPALWWYGGIPVAHPRLDRSRQLDGGPILRVEHRLPGPGCSPDALRAALEDRDRVLVYLGFRFDDVPPGFDELLLDRLRELGRIVDDRPFADKGRVVVVDLRSPPPSGSDWPGQGSGATAAMPRPPGCIAIAPIGGE
jgi:hypothetical protein